MKAQQMTAAGGTHDELGKIFIAGTGRSGTTLLHNLIGLHPHVHRVPYESKFIVEGDGLNALVPRLTSDFSVTASDLALVRFIETMGGELPRKLEGAGPDLDLGYAQYVGADVYYPILNDYIAAISDGELLGFPFPRRFEDRSELIALTRNFVSRMFGAGALAAGKACWVEKTPSNIIAVDFLWELFPEAAVINIKRDPRGVLLSMMEQIWAPNGLERAVRYLEHIYWRWKELKPRLDVTRHRYLEIKLEDLARDAAGVFPHVTAVTGLPPLFPANRSYKLDQVERWKTAMPKEHRLYCETRLAQYFDFMGYDI